MIRFFSEPHEIFDNTIRLTAEDTKHIRTLRLRPDELFVVCDGAGIDYICRLGERADGTIANIVDKQPSSGEPSVKCTVYMAYSKGDRLDIAVQKSVEIGVHEIVLFESERCVAVPKDIPKRITRLQRISLETAKQCGRGIVPSVSHGGKFNKVIDTAAKNSCLAMFFYELENNVHIKDVLGENFIIPCDNNTQDNNTQDNSIQDNNIQDKIIQDKKSISLITGPEGGFELHEAELAQQKGIHIVSLGSRILRSETAPMVALAAVMYHTDNL